MKKCVLILIAMMSFGLVSCKSTKVASVQPSEMQKLQEQLNAKEKEISSLQQELEANKVRLVVYEFFNDESISIFSNNAIENNGGINKLSGKVRTKYETIRLIADVERQLTQIDKKIQHLRQQQQSKKWSAIELKNAVRLDIKADMELLAEQLDAIDKRDLSDLSEIQLDYYRKQSERYDSIERRYLH